MSSLPLKGPDQTGSYSYCNHCLYTITGVFLPSVDRFDEESEDLISTTERSSTTPLLEGTKTQSTGSIAEP